ncbi:hypothetical protein C0991_005013 [Blastosporella zonata]|nr:hypothetical protein C0991_005013 [Blastosporella zonata]
MTTPFTSTSSMKVSKNPGLALDLKRNVLGSFSPSYSVSLRSPSGVSSLSNTPELEPDWTNEHDVRDYPDDEEAQYIYIAADSPFYHAPSTPHTSSYLSVSGFPFACDALAEEDPLFAQPSSSCGDELEFGSKDKDLVVIVDTDFVEDSDSHPNTEWKFTGSLDSIKPARAEIVNEALEQFL